MITRRSQGVYRLGSKLLVALHLHKVCMCLGGRLSFKRPNNFKNQFISQFRQVCGEFRSRFNHGHIKVLVSRGKLHGALVVLGVQRVLLIRHIWWHADI